MFEPLASGLVDRIAATLNEFRIPFGIGGVARFGEGLLPAELVLAEHARLGSTAAILSRTFHRQAASAADIDREMDFALELRKLRDACATLELLSAEELETLHCDLQERVREIVNTISTQNKCGGLVG